MDPSLAKNVSELNAEEFSSPFLQKAFSLILQRIETGKDVTAAAVMSELEPEEAQHISQIMQKPESLADGEKAMGDYIERIKTEYLKRKAKSDIGAVAKLFREKKGYED